MKSHRNPMTWKPIQTLWHEIPFKLYGTKTNQCHDHSLTINWPLVKCFHWWLNECRKRAGNLCLPGTDCDFINWGEQAHAIDLLTPGADTNPGRRRRRSVSDSDLKVSRTKQENDQKVDRKSDNKSEESNEEVKYIPTKAYRGIFDVLHELTDHVSNNWSDEMIAKELLQMLSESNPGRKKRSLSDESDQKVTSKHVKASVQEEEAFGLQALSDLTEGVKPQSLFKSISPEMVDTFLTMCLDDTTCRDDLLTSRLESIKSSSENKFFKRIEWPI